jgi:putative heme iron utilization protein
MSFIYSDEIFKEFVKLSEQQKDLLVTNVDFDKSQFDLISNTNNDLVIDGQPTFVTAAIVASAEDDAKTILEKKYPVESEDMVEKAHPEPVMIADHPYGGLVENQNEQHQRILNVVNKMPTGFPIHSWASIATELIKIAQECDDLGLESEAKAIDEIAQTFFLNKQAGFWDVVKSLGSGAAGLAAWLGRLAIANPVAAGVAAALLAGAGTFWTLWDGIKQDLGTDIQDLIDELEDYNADPDFNKLPGFMQMYNAAKTMQIVYNDLLHALADRAAASKDPSAIAKVIELYNALGQQLNILETNFPIFEVNAPRNISRKLFGFENIKGRIDDLKDLYKDLGEAARLSQPSFNERGDVVSPTDSGERNKASPGGSSGAVTGNAADIKKWLTEHDVSGIIGYEYEMDESPEFDATTRRVLSDLGDKIRQHLGTNVPSTKDLMNSSYTGLESLMQIYREPWSFVKTE